MYICKNGNCFNISENNHHQNKEHRRFWVEIYPNWENDVSQFMDQYCHQNKISLDIGAWNGVHTFYLAHLSKKVYAIEPDPKAFNILVDNCICNKNLYDKIILVKSALSDKNGIVSIMASGDSISSILENVHNQYSFAIENVPCITFRSFLSEYGIEPMEIGFIKMDIEGYEKICIPDMEWFFVNYTGSISLSLHPTIITENDIKEIINMVDKYFVQIKQGCWISKKHRKN